MSEIRRIESLASRAGHKIFTYSQMSLCSRVDPVKEAERWVDRCSGDVKEAQAILVVGVGCGYHLKCLVDRFRGKKIYALDVEPSVLDAVHQIHRLDLCSVRFLQASSASNLLENSQLKSVLAERHVILKFGPATQLYQDNYDDIHRALLGRNEVGLQLLAQSRHWELGNLSFEAEQPKSSQLISAKELHRVFDENNIHNLDRRSLEIVRELLL